MSAWGWQPINRLATVTLGKMVQPRPKNDGDVERPYVRAAHIQPHGRFFAASEQVMWFSPTETAQLDVRIGDVLVVEGGAGYGRPYFVTHDMSGWAFQNSINRLRPFRSRTDGRFLSYALQHGLTSGRIALDVSVATIPHFTAEKVSAFRVPAPDLQSQQPVADFLDRETAKIDALIAKQEQLVADLVERLAADISRAVWRGFSGVGLASAGVDPGGDSPTHWRRLRNKNVMFERTELSESGDGDLLTVSHLTGIRRRVDSTVNMFEAETTEGYKHVQVGDLVINTLWAWMGALGVSDMPGIVSPAYGVYAIRPGAEVLPAYLHYLMRSPAYVTEMTRHSKGVWSSRLRLYPASFLGLNLILPPLNEQQEIVSHLRQRRLRTEALTAKAQQLISTMRERRAALIAAAVTGQIDVATYGKRG